MDFLHGAYYASWAFVVGIAFTIAILKKTLPTKPDDSFISRIRDFLESRAPLVPEALYSCSSCLFYTIVVTALVGMAFQIWVVFRGKPNELVVASLMVYNFISCAWPLCGKAFDGLGKDSWVRPQGVVVFLSFLCMVLAVASYLNQNPEPWFAALLVAEGITSLVDLGLYIPPWDVSKDQNTLTKRFEIDNDQQGYEIED